MPESPKSTAQEKAYKQGGYGGDSRMRDEEKERKAREGFAPAVAKEINEAFITWAQEFGGELKTTSTQMRGVFSLVKRLEIEFKARDKKVNRPEVLMLKPRLAYAATRDKDLKFLKAALSAGVDEVIKGADDKTQAERFERFCRCCEAILAYSKK